MKDNLFEKWMKYEWKTWLTMHYQKIAFGFLLLVVTIMFFSQKEEKANPYRSADTYIPPGFVLVPIEVINRQALDSLLGPYGVVDLYLPPENSDGGLMNGQSESRSAGYRMGRKVASRAKILRAPLKPDEFAVLVREVEASQLVHGENSYFVVIQNPNQVGTHIVKPLIRRSRISFEGG